MTSPAAWMSRLSLSHLLYAEMGYGQAVAVLLVGQGDAVVGLGQ